MSHEVARVGVMWFGECTNIVLALVSSRACLCVLNDAFGSFPERLVSYFPLTWDLCSWKEECWELPSEGIHAAET